MALYSRTWLSMTWAVAFLHLERKYKVWAVGKLGGKRRWSRYAKGAHICSFHFSLLTHLPGSLDFSATAKRLLYKATLEQCQQKHLAPIQCILGLSSARPWKLHVGLISQGKGRRQGVCRGSSGLPCHMLPAEEAWKAVVSEKKCKRGP